MIASPTYYRTRPVTPQPDEPDYPTLQKLLDPYEPGISIEQAKRIGDFLIRLHMYVNEPGSRDIIEVKEEGDL